MILLPQEATVMAGSPMHKIIPALQKANAMNYIYPLNNSNKVVQFLTNRAEIESLNVPAFTIPIYYKDTLGKPRIAIDCRIGRNELMSDVETKDVYSVANTHTEMMTNFSLLMFLWVNNPIHFHRVYFDASRIYAVWASGKIAKQLKLDAIETNQLLLEFGYFFLTRYQTVKVLHEQDYHLLVNRICKQFGFNPNEVYATLDKFNCEVPETLEDFCKAVERNHTNPKMKNFNPLLVITCLFNSWMFVANARELVGIAVEYPPMFLTMLHRALSQRSFKDTAIAQVGLRLMNSSKQKDYIRDIEELLYIGKTERV